MRLSRFSLLAFCYIFIHLFSLNASAVESRSIICVATAFSDHRDGSCANIAKRAASIYNTNANGKVTFTGTGGSYKVAGPWSKANYKKAVAGIKRKYGAKHKYIIVLATKRKGSAIGMGVVNLGQRLYSVSTHEVGHMLKFGHSTTVNKIRKKIRGRFRWVMQNDKDTPMASSSSGSKFLLPSQLLKAGFLDEVERTTLTELDESTTFEITKSSIYTRKLETKSLKLVRIPACIVPKNGADCAEKRMVVISYPNSCDNCVGVYFNSNGRGYLSTQRIAKIQLGDESSKVWEDTEHTGLRLTLTKVAGAKTIKVTIGEETTEEFTVAEHNDEVVIGAKKIDPTKPRRINRKGAKKLLCIGVKYNDNTKSVAKSACMGNARKMAAFYNKNSRGLLQVKPFAKAPFKINLNGNKLAYKKAVRAIKAKHPGFDYYVIPGVYTNSHAGGKVAHVKGIQTMTSLHEVGHLVGLGHSGRYEYPKKGKKGKIHYASYGDGSSIMSRFYSSYISAPQYYYLGWLKEEAYTFYTPETPSYTLRNIGDVKKDGLATVIVNPELMLNNRWAFISIIKCKEKNPCVAIHLQNKGGSMKVKQFSNEYYDERFTGLHVKVLKRENGLTTISVDFKKKALIEDEQDIHEDITIEPVVTEPVVTEQRVRASCEDKKTLVFQRLEFTPCHELIRQTKMPKCLDKNSCEMNVKTKLCGDYINNFGTDEIFLCLSHPGAKRVPKYPSRFNAFDRIIPTCKNHKAPISGILEEAYLRGPKRKSGQFVKAPGVHKRHSREIFTALKNKNWPRLKRLTSAIGAEACKRKDVDGDDVLVITPKKETGEEYVGFILLFRLTNAIPIVIEGAHLDSGVLNQSEKIFAASKVMAAIVPGHNRISAPWGPEWRTPCRPKKTISAESMQNLFFHAKVGLAESFPTTKFIELHKMKARYTSIKLGKSTFGSATKDSFMYAFAKGVFEEVKDPKLKERYVANNGGTLLRVVTANYAPHAWTAKHLQKVGKPCKYTSRDPDTNRFIHIEQGSKFQRDIPQFVRILDNMVEQGYIKPTTNSF